MKQTPTFNEADPGGILGWLRPCSDDENHRHNDRNNLHKVRKRSRSLIRGNTVVTISSVDVMNETKNTIICRKMRAVFG